MSGSLSTSLTLADKVIAVCEREWDAYKSDCSGFVKAVAANLGLVLVGQANHIIDAVAGGWQTAKDGPAAAAQAEAGMFVIGGLKDQPHGHVVVIVKGPLNRGQYPTAYWGQFGGVGRKATTINWSWSKEDRDNVIYFYLQLRPKPADGSYGRVGDELEPCRSREALMRVAEYIGRPIAVALSVLPWTQSMVHRAAACEYSPMTFDRGASSVIVQEFAVTIANPDSVAAPSIWEGPLVIRNRTSGKSCSVSPPGLIDRPLFSHDRHFLVLVTTSGSNFRTVTVDLAACAVVATGEKSSGPIDFAGGEVFVAGRLNKALGCEPVR